MSAEGLYFIPGIVFIGGAILLFYGYRATRRFMLIADTPRSKIRGIAMGLVEIHGWAYAAKYIKAPYSGTECVYCRNEMQELRQHGKTTSWVTLKNEVDHVPVMARDETGDVLVDPRGAEFVVSLNRAYEQKCGTFGGGRILQRALELFKGERHRTVERNRHVLRPMDHRFGSSLGNALGDRRYYEYCIDKGQRMYVLGTAYNLRGASGGVIIRKGEDESFFLISDKSEENLIKKKKGKGLALLTLGGMVIFVGAILAYYLSLYI